MFKGARIVELETGAIDANLCLTFKYRFGKVKGAWVLRLLLSLAILRIA
jgi:hypothetical protein